MSSLREEQSRFLLDLCKLIVWATEQGYKVTGGELWRPPQMQEIYVKTGRSKTMKSKHLDRLAADLNFFDGAGNLLTTVEQLTPIGLKWESMDVKNAWGGFWKSFKDIPHFERRT